MFFWIKSSMPMRPFLRLIGYCGVLSSLVFVSGCLAPPYVRPKVNLPLAWQRESPHPLTLSTIDCWWRHFHDPILNHLIEEDSLGNLHIQIAKERVSIAQAEYRAAFAQLFPTANALALPPNGTGSNLTQVIGLTTGLELDIFGKQYYTRHGRAANIQVNKAEHAFAVLKLQVEIVSSYLEFRETQAKIKLLEAEIARNKQMLSFLSGRKKAGLTSYINVVQQTALVETQYAELAQNRALLSMLSHKIELLTGHNPSALRQQLSPYRAIPENTQSIELGIPAKLLSRRPDLVAAEQKVAAAHANVQVAIASLFPQPSIGWIIAWQTETVANLLQTLQQPDSTFFGTLTAPIINLSLYRIVDVRKREEALIALQYQLTVMQALHEVETEYDYYQHYQSSTEHLKKARSKKRLALKLINDRFQHGFTDFSNVLRAEEDVSRSEMAYLHSLVLWQEAKIKIYKALGGGWTLERGDNCSPSPRALVTAVGD